MSLWKLLTAAYNDSGDNNTVRIDASTASLQTIEYEHHEIHGGSHYYYEDNVTLDATETVDIGWQVSNTTAWTHFTFQITSQAEVVVALYEAATITFDGTALTAVNNNRNSGNTSNWQEFELDPTVNAVGTQISEVILGTSTNPNNGLPGGLQRNRELVLDQNAVYLLRVTSNVNDNAINITFEWYEHTDKA